MPQKNGLIVELPWDVDIMLCKHGRKCRQLTLKIFFSV